jgi:hypothetical protein
MPRYTQEDEQIPHSEFGIVKDEEYLLRILYEPEHILNGSILETAISLTDLKEKGFSLDRESYVDNIVIQQRITTQTDRNPTQRQSNVITKFKCVDVRSISDEAMNERLFIIIDDIPPDNNQAHAAIYSSKENLGRGALRKLRWQLLPILQKGLSF